MNKKQREKALAFSNACHEVFTPLTSLKCCVAFLEEKIEDIEEQEVKELIQSLSRHTEHTISTVKNFIDTVR